MKIHEKYISRCIEIAKNGLGTTAPNPMVGCVIVYNSTIIGEGFTCPYGGAHAEVNAINSVKDTSLLKEATLYVTLEPCSHFGKTPPCSNLIIEHGIPNIVIGCLDDNEKVAGKGIAKLKAADCNVKVGVLEEECKEHHKRFFTFHNKKRPYIILKWAETADGFIAPLHKKEKQPVWITNTHSRQLVHKWRAEEQAILVGTNTVLEDNPSLTTRDWDGKNPIRIVLDKHNILSKEFKVFDNKAKTLIINDNSAKGICNKLYEADINSVIIEGGAKTLKLFINSGLWDEARVFTGKNTFKEGIKAPVFAGNLISEKQILDDTLKIYVNN
ncbi:bifunctional diaminohydroxyphosphoribosylaminopyrimidine deaminase/5-amino-6-(5-phosphoribosylamino)uracil reductase RibD [Flavobacteriaceae bacterium S0825]|uniref:bifunctional diaminohydroxyphosphoribosylaminopyrimidine deaminase/5-amino-6-(5-phosphoribosylamino)uracil reductase RibD n=1 Tax=Gaetbulibacter sp. S0825 TaxID=2720084 RepID=UPI00142F40D7|nr:bifunctional diaminohydroxyphosphoribosylaminopyrimidine deaminase/5-amino-6-(5-phosphoribosylamino)uracil reductase RibD [Flavobacteriaceae bacterium S0825]NIX64802.1 bifunctional diaminohydroxyphosphoribosylaminopyrimidine deaminase/5-amino-6-(5-phosphoribosylamino)uracil reductase RibD [Gaetbulibacter sp. S0825]